MPDYVDPGPAEAYITAGYYESLPHLNVWLQKMQTTSAKPGGHEWQKVSLEFTTPKWAPFVNIAFVANACTAYLDDFELVEIEG